MARETKCTNIGLDTHYKLHEWAEGWGFSSGRHRISISALIDAISYLPAEEVYDLLQSHELLPGQKIY